MMSRADAIAQLQSLRQEARAKAYPRSRLAIQEYMDPGTAAADAVALTMAIQGAAGSCQAAHAHLGLRDVRHGRRHYWGGVYDLCDDIKKCHHQSCNFVVAKADNSTHPPLL